MPKKREAMNKIINSKKLTGREAAALIIENHVSQMYGDGILLTEEEKAKIKQSLIGRNNEAIEFNAWIDTFMVVKELENEGTIKVLKAIYSISRLKELALSSITRSVYEAIPEALTRAEYEERLRETTDEVMSAVSSAEEVLTARANKLYAEQESAPEYYSEIYEDKPEFFIQSLQQISALLSEGKLTACKLPAELLLTYETLKAEQEEHLNRIAASEYFLDSREYRALMKKIEAMESTFSEHPVESEELIKVLQRLQQKKQFTQEDIDQLAPFYITHQSLYDADLPEWREVLEFMIKDIPNVMIIADDQPGMRTAEKIVEHHSKAIRAIGSGVKTTIESWEQYLEENNLSTGAFVSTFINTAVQYISEALAIEKAIEEVENLLKVKIMRQLKLDKEALYTTVEGYNALVEDEKNKKGLFLLKDARLPMIDIEALKPSEKRVASYRSQLESYLGPGWIQFAMEQLLDEDEEDKRARDLTSFISFSEDEEEIEALIAQQKAYKDNHIVGLEMEAEDA